MSELAWFTYRLEVVGEGPSIRETRPEHCSNGHSLAGGRCIIGLGELNGERYRTWECRTCGQITWGRRG